MTKSLIDGLSATEAEINAAIENINTAQDGIESINRLIESQHAIIAEVVSSTPNGQLVESQREDLLADIASGTKTREDLDNFEKQAKTIEDAVAEAREQSRHAGAAISGLERKRLAAVQALEVAQAAYSDVCKRFVAAEYKKTLKAYERHAQATLKEYKKLVGFERFLAQHGLRGSIISQSTQMLIPKFRYLGSEWADNRKSCLFDPARHVDRSAFESIVRTKLEQSGVEAV